MSDGAEDWEHLSDATSSTYDCLTPSTTMSEEDPTRENDGEIPTEDISRAEVNETPPKDTSKEKEKKTPSKDTSKEKDKKTTSKDTSKEKEKKISPKDTSKKEESKASQNNLAKPIEHHAIPGRSFMIRSRQKPYRFLLLKNGQPELLEKPIPDGGAYWHCHEKNNWYGFRNTVSGNYLGHNGEGKILATEDSHGVAEYFHLSRKEGGGYVLLTLHEQNSLQIAISEDGKSLVEQENGGEAWDFIDADHFDIPVRLRHPNGTVEELR